MNALPRPSRLAATICAAGFFAAACSSSSTSAAGPAVPPATSAASTPITASSAASTPAQSATDGTAPAAGGDAGDCGTAHAAAGTVLTGNADVKSFEIGAGCDVTISTSFSDVGDPKAIALCDAAAKVAYLVGGKSVTVLGVGNTEIAIGIKGQPCIRG